MNKTGGGDGIPVELLQILKDDPVRVLHSICQQILKTQQWPQDWKRSVFIPIPKKGNAKECVNCHTIALISHASKVMLKILWTRLQQCMNCELPDELPDVQAGFRKGRGTRDQIGNIHWIIKRASSVQFSSVTQSCLTLCDPMNCSTPGLPVHHQLREFTHTTFIESVMPSSHLILCRPFLLLPPGPPSIKVFSNESTLHLRWPKYWSFSFSH